MRHEDDRVGSDGEAALERREGCGCAEELSRGLDVRRHFARVERRAATGWVTFPGRADAERYLKAMAGLAGPAELAGFEGPLRARRSPYVFVAEK